MLLTNYFCLCYWLEWLISHSDDGCCKCFIRCFAYIDVQYIEFDAV